MNLDYFQILKWILQTVRAVKVEEKMGVISLVSMFPSWFMVLRWSKKLDFLQIFLSIYIYASESFHYSLSENGL